MSADIVGSTALKQSPRRGPEVSSEWFGVIQGFYLEIQREFLKHWSDAREKLSDDFLGDAPELWKVIGDEAVFVKNITDHRQVYYSLCCWRAAVQDVRRFIRRSGRLDLKCTSWIAGFQVMNKEVVVDRSDKYLSSDTGDFHRDAGRRLNDIYSGQENEKISVDYVGPAIDIGFRLSSHSTPRKFILSVGVAYILALSNPPDPTLMAELEYGYEGAVALKGVFGGTPYPLFWIDMAGSGDLATIEDDLLGRSRANTDLMRKFCVKFYDDNEAYTFPPFVESSGDGVLSKRPSWYNEALEKLASNFRILDMPESDGSGERDAEEEPLDPDLGEVTDSVDVDRIIDDLVRSLTERISSED